MTNIFCEQFNTILHRLLRLFFNQYLQTTGMIVEISNNLFQTFSLYIFFFFSVVLYLFSSYNNELKNLCGKFRKIEDMSPSNQVD